MLYHFYSFKFLIFFAVVFGVYWGLPRHRLRMVWLLLASCVFYMSWNPWLILLILFTAAFDYAVAIRLETMRSPAHRRLLLALSIGTSLALLAFFKYTNFLLDSARTTLNLFGAGVEPVLVNIVLPLGISFYTFETISYVVDVYLGRVKAVRDPVDYALYILFFPHLIAGPIVRPRDFLPQIRRAKRFNWDRVQLGAQFFLIGLFKKVVLADHLATVADPVFAEPSGYATSAVWLAVLAYAGQIYCDFSGYSDMAVGLAHALGFRLPVNFRMPYFAASITEFWRRWHISLSSWLRDYLYVPLGGNRGGRLATYRNLLATMLLGGLWHGASWTFVLWGAYHGVLLALHRLLPRPRILSALALRPLGVAATFLAVCVGWVFFRAQSLGDAGTLLSRMFAPAGGTALDLPTTLIAAGCLAVLLAGHLVGTFVDLKRAERRAPAAVLGAGLAGLLLAVLFLMPVNAKGFIYFQF